ncbi:hypothetical protein [Acidovorax sp. CCYZU-2555]|nr:hypothetical protein [Acidovorax sp. CCYZU-2555]
MSKTIAGLRALMLQAGPQALRTLQRREVRKWAEVARKAHVKLD